jgi:RNA polymerase sigma-70 factor (ECF subfamily)
MEVSLEPDSQSHSASLVARILAGDRNAEAELVEHYSRGVALILVRSAGGGPINEDLRQDTFQLTIQKIRRGELRDPERLPGFICNIARNLAVDYFRRTSRHERVERDLPVAAPAPPDALEQVLAAEKAAIVRRILSELRPERDREVLYRFYIEEQEKQQICAELGLTSLHFNRVLFRARARYKQLYENVVRKQSTALG